MGVDVAAVYHGSNFCLCRGERWSQHERRERPTNNLGIKIVDWRKEARSTTLERMTVEAMGVRQEVEL